MPVKQSNQRAWGLLIVLMLITVVVWVLGLGVGSAGFEQAWHMWQDPASRHIVLEIRAPRNTAAWLAGALLALSGAVAQGLFRNPLADPFLLGSASGAALAVAGALAMYGISPYAAGWVIRLGLTGFAFIGAMVAVLLAMALAQGGHQTMRLLLAGVVVSVVLGALTALITLYFPATLQAMQSFNLGSTAYVGWQACGVMLFVLVVCAAVAGLLSRALDGLSLGEATAQSLGLPVAAMRLGLTTVMALATGTAVAQTGLIAFVGLVAPHLVRALLPSRHGMLLLLSAAMGALLLLVSDILARWLLAPQELPVGVLTAILGGCYLLWLMHRRAMS